MTFPLFHFPTGLRDLLVWGVATLPVVSFALGEEKDPDGADVTTLELAPGLVVPLASPRPIDWETVGADRLLKLFLDQLRSDPSDELEYRIEIVRELMADGDFDLAEQIAGEIRQEDRSEIVAEIACGHIEAGDPARGRAMLEEAESWLVYSLDMHREAAMRFIATGYARLGEVEEARQVLGRIKDPFARARVEGVLLAEAGTSEETEAFLKESGEPSVLPQVDLLIDMAADKLKEGEIEEAERLFTRAGEKAFQLRKITGFAKVGRIVETLLQAEASEKAAGHLESYIRGIQVLADEMPEKGVLLATAAKYSRILGKIELAESLLEEAESKIKKVFVLYAARPLTAIAAQRTAMGATERAAQLIDIAARSAAAYDHVRGKAMGAVWVCLYYHQTGLSMEPGIREEMKKAAGS